MDADARLEAVLEENERLRDRVAFLEASLLGDSFLAPAEWRLTTSEARVLACLLARTFCTKDTLMAALYRDDGRDEPEIKIVDVFICKVRKKLKPFGVFIDTVWGQGYRLDEANKHLVKEALARGVVQQVADRLAS